MKNTALKVLLTAAVLTPVAVYAQPRPGNPTTATVITKEEIAKVSATEQSARTLDQNAKVVDIGDGWSMELGIIHRSSTHLPPAPPNPANAGAAAQRIPCGEQIRLLERLGRSATNSEDRAPVAILWPRRLRLRWRKI